MKAFLPNSLSTTDTIIADAIFAEAIVIRPITARKGQSKYGVFAKGRCIVTYNRIRDAVTYVDSIRKSMKITLDI